MHFKGLSRNLYPAFSISGPLKRACHHALFSGKRSVMALQALIFEQFEEVAHDQHKQLAALTPDMVLLDSGLDSLCFAIIMARLEDALGVDPFTAAEDVIFPATLGEFVKFYEDAADA
jgi:acyl carrier protein